MLRRVLLAPIALLLTACSLSASFKPEVDEFYHEAMKRRCFVFEVDMYFARLESEVAGYCIPTFGILINEDGWDSYEEYQKKELIFHELGHCALGLSHSDDGLMTSKMHSEKELKENWNRWLDLLFKDCLKF